MLFAFPPCRSPIRYARGTLSAAPLFPVIASCLERLATRQGDIEADWRTSGTLLRWRHGENSDLERQFDQGAAEQRARLARGGAARHSLPAGDQMPGGGFSAARDQIAGLSRRDGRPARL